MAIDVKIKCSDCGTVVDHSLHAQDTEIVCPECRRAMPNLLPEEYKEVAKTLSSERVMGIVALFFVIIACVLLVLYIGPASAWVSTDDKDYLDRMAKAGISRNADTSMFFFGAIGCIVLAGVFGALSAVKRFVVEF